MNNNSIDALGVVANVLKDDNAVLEQNVIFTLSKDESATVELVVGVFDDTTNSGVISMTVKSVTDIDVKPNTIRFGVNNKTGECIIILYNWLPNTNNDTSPTVINKRIAKYNNRNIRLEMIITHGKDRSNTTITDNLVVYLNIYSQT